MGLCPPVVFWRLLCLLVVVCTLPALAEKHVCYFHTSDIYNVRSNIQGLKVPDINASLCTHIVYQGAQIPPSGGDKKAYVENEWQGARKDLVRRVRGRSKTPDILAGLKVWPDYLVNPSDFHENAIRMRDYIVRYSLQGVSLTWDGQDNEDNFTRFAEVFREVFNNVSTKLELVLHAKPNVSLYYNVTRLTRVMDFFTLGTDGWEECTQSQTSDASPLQRMKQAVHDWRAGGVPSDKLVVGVATFGCSRTATATPRRKRRRRRKRSGSLSGPGVIVPYPQICRDVQTRTAIRMYSNQGQEPYLYDNVTLTTYEDPTSLQQKLSYLREEKLAGWMVWKLTTDDHSGQTCRTDRSGTATYPLLRALNTQVTTPSEGQTITQSTSPPTTQSTSPPTTKSTSPPTTQSTSPPTTKSTSPPTTQSTSPPTTQSTSPPTTQSTSPPTTQSTSPPTTKSTSPPTTQSTSPPTTSPPTTKSTSPPTTKSTSPPTTKSTSPPTTKSTSTPTTKSTSPPTTKSTSPPTTKSTSPPTTKSTSPPTTSPPTTKSTSPPTTKSTSPPTTKSTSPSTTKSTSPPTTKSTSPLTTKSTSPPTTKSTSPPTTKSTSPPTTKSTSPPTTKSTSPPTTQSTTMPASQDPELLVDCSDGDGLFADPTDTSKFIQCSNGRRYIKKCPDGLEFNPASLVCDWPH